MEAEDFAGCQPEGDSAHWSIRPSEVDQLGRQPLGFQTRIWLLRTLGQVGARWLRRSMVLYHQSRVLRASGSPASNGITRRFLRRPPQLRCETTAMVLL